MSYRLLIHKDLIPWMEGLPDDEKQALRNLLQAIRENPLGGDAVESEEPLLYQKTYNTNRAKWPNGLRVKYQIRNDMAILIVDAGDHVTTIRFPGQSFYPDER